MAWKIQESKAGASYGEWLEFWQSYIDALPGLAYVRDGNAPGCPFLLINRFAAMITRDGEDALGKTASDFWRREEAKRLDALTAREVETKCPVHFEVSVALADGAIRRAEVYEAPLNTAFGCVILGYARYAPREDFERQVTAALAMLTKFTAPYDDRYAMADTLGRQLLSIMKDWSAIAYVFAGESTAHYIPRPDSNLKRPKPDREASLINRLWNRIERGGYASVPELSLLAVPLSDGMRPIGMGCVILRDSVKISGRDLAWYRLLSDTVSVVVARWRRQLEAQKKELNVRAQAWAHASGSPAPKPAPRSARLAPSPMTEAVQDWLKSGVGANALNILAGIRGVGKSAAFLDFKTKLVKEGVPADNIVSIDFEDAHFRHLKTARDFAAFIDCFKPEGAGYLFLEEPSALYDFPNVFSYLLEKGTWNIWVSTSNDAVIQPVALEGLQDRVRIKKMLPDPSRPRDAFTLSRAWGTMFMRDVVSGVGHADIRAKEALCEYFCDHLGDVIPLRRIADELRVDGRNLAANTISAYRRALCSSFFLEVSDGYDLFEHVPVKTGDRVFCMDLALRAWRFGPSAQNEERRIALNRLYLKLRQTHDKVYSPRDVSCKADFMTFSPKGEYEFWSVTPKG